MGNKRQFFAFPRVRMEMERARITMEELSERIYVPSSTLRRVLIGRREIYLWEALAIREALGAQDIPLEVLFESSERSERQCRRS